MRDFNDFGGTRTVQHLDSPVDVDMPIPVADSPAITPVIFSETLN